MTTTNGKYHDAGPKTLYVVNLNEGSRVEMGLDAGPDLDALIDQQVRAGWEDAADRLPLGMLTIAKGKAHGPIVATVTWVAVPGQDWPDLIVHVLATAEVRRYARVEEDPVYGARRVA